MVLAAAKEYDIDHTMRNRSLFAALLTLLLSAVAAADGRDNRELLRDALAWSPEYTQPLVMEDGAPVAFFRDLNGDGETDVILLTVLHEEGVPRSLPGLRATSRLFRPADPIPLFVVETYFAGDEGIHTVDLGRWPALGTIEFLELTGSGGLPVALAVETRRAAGDQNTLLIYSGHGRIRTLQLQETQRERYHLADITGDGVLDVVVATRAPEAGRGYETFLELLELGDGAYHSSASFPVVRDLRSFLDQAASHMIAGRWDELASLVADGGGAGGLSRAGVLAAAFRGVPGEEESEAAAFDHAETGRGLAAVMLPVILESPFPFPYADTRFSLLFRVETEDGAAWLYSATVGMAANPFAAPRFAFLTTDNPQQ